MLARGRTVLAFKAIGVDSLELWTVRGDEAAVRLMAKRVFIAVEKDIV